MRVLYDHQIFVAQKFGGISRYFNELMQMENDGVLIKKVNPDLFPPQDREPKYTLLSRGLNYVKRKVGIENKVTKIPQEAANLFADNGYDIFHPTYYDPYFLEFTKKPFVLTVHDMIHEIYREYLSMSDRTTYNKRLLCEKASQIISVSHQTKADLVELFKIPEEKIRVIYLASNFDKVIPRRPENAGHLTNYILFTGNRDLYKNFYFTLIALADILKADKDLQLLCTGYGLFNDEIQFFKDLGIARQVHHIYLKNDQELAWAYQNAKIFIFPSLYEGFGLPMLEAFASKCPVVASNGGSLPEVGGKAALYFNPKSSKQIQDAAVKALYDNATRSDLIAEGEKQFAKFSWDKCRAETINVYNKSLYLN